MEVAALLAAEEVIDLSRVIVNETDYSEKLHLSVKSVMDPLETVI